MSAKAVLFFIAQVLFVQCISSQLYGPACAGQWGAAAGSAPWNAAPLAASWATAPMAGAQYATAEWATGFSPANLAASNSASLPVSTASPFAPNGVALISENTYEGPLSVAGALPFLGTVALEGALPTAGAGAVMYGCGNGNVAMLSEDIPAGYGAARMGYDAAAAYGLSPYGCRGY